MAETLLHFVLSWFLPDTCFEKPIALTFGDTLAPRRLANEIVKVNDSCRYGVPKDDGPRRLRKRVSPQRRPMQLLSKTGSKNALDLMSVLHPLHPIAAFPILKVQTPAATTYHAV